jgi:glutamate synthase (NADPH/NADH) small chain
LVTLAMGFTGPESSPWTEHLNVALDDRGNIVRDRHYMTNVPGRLSCRRCRSRPVADRLGHRGGSFGRSRGRHLPHGQPMPSPIPPSARQLTV